MNANEREDKTTSIINIMQRYSMQMHGHLDLCFQLWILYNYEKQHEQERLVLILMFSWLPSVYIRIADIRRDQIALQSVNNVINLESRAPSTNDRKKTSMVGWSAPSVFAGGRLRTPLPSRLHRKAVYFYTDPNLVSLCPYHFCTCRKQIPVKVYAF